MTNVTRNSAILLQLSILGLTGIAFAQTATPPATIQIPLVFHDVHHSHPNFEKSMTGLKKGIVKDQLGVDGLPVWNATTIAKTYTNLTNEADFNRWWMATPGITKRVTGSEIIGGPCAGAKLTLTRNSSGMYVFDSSSFFPLATANLSPGAGLTPFPCGANTARNYHFTMELHNEFTYRPGQIFNFRGDDDVWVFINNKLVIDLGGVHGPVAGSVNLDTLGLTAGVTYPLDLFFAERRTTGSNFLMTTDLVFTPTPVLDTLREVANSAPTVAIPNSGVVIKGARNIELTPQVTDDALPRSGGGIKCQWTTEKGPGVATFATPTAASTLVTFPSVGRYCLRLTVSDGEIETFGDVFVDVLTAGIGTITTNLLSKDDYTNANKVWADAKLRLGTGAGNVPVVVEKRGFDASEYHLDYDSEVIVTVVYDGARKRNSLSWYDAANPQILTPIWHDFATGPLAPLWVGRKSSLGVLPAGTDLRFAIICDGARGGTTKFYMDPSLNPGSSAQVAGRIFNDVSGVERPRLLAWEDIGLGPKCDYDFNDVVYQVEMFPVALSDTQYSNVIAGRAGLMVGSGTNGVASMLAQQGVAADRYELANQLFYIPTTAGTYTVNLFNQNSAMKTEVRVFDYDSVRGLNPQSLNFRTTAAKNSVLLFDERTLAKGGSVTFDPSKLGIRGKTVGLIFVPNNTRDVFLTNPWRYSPKGEGNDTKRQPLFSLISANPGQIDQLLTFGNSKSTFFFLEDKTRYEDGVEVGGASDSSFNDLAFKVSPPLKYSNLNLQGYYEATPDTTYGYNTENDGNPKSVTDGD